VGLSQRRRALVARLKYRKTRVREERVLVEGVRAVAEARRAGANVRFAVCSPRLRSTLHGDALVEDLGAVTELLWVADEELASLSDMHVTQGIMAVCTEPHWTLQDVMSRKEEGVLLLDGVQDPGNVGTLVRTGVGFGVGGVVALEGTVDLWSTKVVRASAGAVFQGPMVRASWDAVESVLKDHEVPLFLADPSGVDARTVSAAEGWALVLGNEGAGGSPAIRSSAGTVLRVPMAGDLDCLNVAVAGAILLYILKTNGRSGRDRGGDPTVLSRRVD